MKFITYQLSLAGLAAFSVTLGIAFSRSFLDLAFGFGLAFALTQFVHEDSHHLPCTNSEAKA